MTSMAAGIAVDILDICLLYIHSLMSTSFFVDGHLSLLFFIDRAQLRDKLV